MIFLINSQAKSLDLSLLRGIITCIAVLIQGVTGLLIRLCIQKKGFYIVDLLKDSPKQLFSKYLMSNNENIRKQAFESMYSLYKKHINTITELYLARVKQRVISSKIRNYESSLDAATNHDDSNVKVYETLLNELNKNLYLNHEYMDLNRTSEVLESIVSENNERNINSKDETLIINKLKRELEDFRMRSEEDA